MNPLNPGIRRTVAWLRSEGFITTDSGDGVTNLAAGMEGALPFPHVFMRVPPDVAHEEARRLLRLLKSHGLDVDPGLKSAEAGQTPEAYTRSVCASYLPEPDVAMLELIGLDDSSHTFGPQPIETLYIFDADSTLRRCTVPGRFCPNRPSEWEVIPWAQTRLAAIDWTKNGFGIASNQGGVALGHVSETVAVEMLDDLAWLLTGRRPERAAIQTCPHDPHEGCACRKPSGAMLKAVMRAYGALPEQVVYVGDLESDELAANAADVRFEWVWDFCGQTEEAWKGWLVARAAETAMVTSVLVADQLHAPA